MTSRSEEIRSEPEKKGFISLRGGRRPARGTNGGSRGDSRPHRLFVPARSAAATTPARVGARSRRASLRSFTTASARAPPIASSARRGARRGAHPAPRFARHGRRGRCVPLTRAFLAFVGADLGTIHPLGIPASPASPTPLPSPPEDEWTVVAKKSRRKMNAAGTRAPPEPARDHARSPPSPLPRSERLTRRRRFFFPRRPFLLQPSRISSASRPRPRAPSRTRPRRRPRRPPR